jgi:acyl transferase domain-containing protein
MTSEEDLLQSATRAFLVEQFNWIKTFRSAVSSSLQDRNSRVIEFGPERCVPPTLLRRLNSQITHFDFENSINTLGVNSSAEAKAGMAEDDIAVIGMSCKVAGASDLDEYWKILLEGKSQHRELVPNDRFAMETPSRPYEDGDEKKKWYGNFIDDHDAFDYKFFKKSPREVLHMDPQQRLILQAAYQAVAQSGYYHNPKADRRIGCYIGVVANDYENNIACTTPTPFSATGALRSYIAGKVSHYFGWTGPGMTIDTACSASTVALDLARQAILSGDCSAALVGGTNFYSTPMFFQNLAAGSFLSPTGQCKPFDTKADGYCRGEAIGAVFLKKLSNAIADGDQIMGVISATAINQNMNTTPIFVPNPVSLTGVFRSVLEKSGLDVKDVSVVEAHGTGTPVGDPAEYDSVRQVFGGASRAGRKPLQIGSVKGLVGHTEGASGVVALIKILLMMQEGRIPPQASFNSMNPSIKASASDNMEITKIPLPWDDDSKVALINNYGAAGSNASMVVKEAPKSLPDRRSDQEASETLRATVSSLKYPFYISGLDDKSIRAYATRLRAFLKDKVTSGDRLGIENLAFNVNRQSNWSLRQALVFSSGSLEDLDKKLEILETFPAPATRPVILCFGGQVSKFVGLDREIFEKTAALRHHLDRCDSVCKKLSAGSIYPGIFQREPIDDPSLLQPLLFAMQYSAAMSWIDCGVEPAAVVGHSFGELTALCVSGALSLEDALTMILGRSNIIRDAWGPEKGSMIAVEADLEDVESLLLAANSRLSGDGSTDGATIACFNGPRSFTLAGSVAAIDALQETISARGATQPALKHKRLDVTNAFHSTLVERLKPDLEALGRKLSFGQSKIPLERSTQLPDDHPLAAAYVANHMRQPVYFNHAVQRLAKQHPEAIWLEAGSNSTVTAMAGRALGMPKGAAFQAVNLTGSNQVFQHLVDTTINLWKAGLRVSFWAHSRRQTYQYAPIILPPYQFEKHRHWLEFKPPLKLVGESTSSEKKDAVKGEVFPTGPFTFLGYGDKGENECRFVINTTVKEYTDVISRHTTARTAPTCPPIFGLDLAIQAITSIRPELANALHPQIYNVVNQFPISDQSRGVLLSFERLSTDAAGWSFKFTSNVEGTGETVNLSGQLYFHPVDDARTSLEFSRFERLVTHDRCLRALEAADDADHVIQGRSIYKVYSDIVDYGDQFRGLQKLVGRPNESAGRVIRRRSSGSWLDFALAEAFAQVGAIWANCMAGDRRTADDTIHVGTSIEQWTRSPDVLRRMSEGAYQYDQPEEWHVLAQHKRIQPGDSYITDIFVFDAASGSLEEVILGIRYTPIPM